MFPAIHVDQIPRNFFDCLCDAYQFRQKTDKKTIVSALEALASIAGCFDYLQVDPVFKQDVWEPFVRLFYDKVLVVLDVDPSDNEDPSIEKAKKVLLAIAGYLKGLSEEDYKRSLATYTLEKDAEKEFVCWDLKEHVNNPLLGIRLGLSAREFQKFKDDITLLVTTKFHDPDFTDLANTIMRETNNLRLLFSNGVSMRDVMALSGKDAIALITDPNRFYFLILGLPDDAMAIQFLSCEEVKELIPYKEAIIRLKTHKLPIDHILFSIGAIRLFLLEHVDAVIRVCSDPTSLFLLFNQGEAQIKCVIENYKSYKCLLRLSLPAETVFRLNKDQARYCVHHLRALSQIINGGISLNTLFFRVGYSVRAFLFSKSKRMEQLNKLGISRVIEWLQKEQIQWLEERAELLLPIAEKYPTLIHYLIQIDRLALQFIIENPDSVEKLKDLDPEGYPQLSPNKLLLLLKSPPEAEEVIAFKKEWKQRQQASVVSPAKRPRQRGRR